MKLREEAKQVLDLNASETFQLSKEYSFGRKLVDTFYCLDQERLQSLKAPGKNWAMMLSSVASIGQKLTFEGLEDVVP